MIESISISAIMGLAAAISAIGGAYLTIRKIAKDAERQKKHHAAEILQSAKEADKALKNSLEGRIHELEVGLKDLREDINKDIRHLKESYNVELKNLGEKIEALRDELRQQHAGILTLLNKMIDKK